MKYVAILAFALVGCGTPTPDNNGGDAGAQASNNTTSTTNNTIPTGTTGTTGGACDDIGQRFVEAVRAMPRGCSTDAGCKIVPRGGICDCDLSVTSSTETTDFEAVRAEMDGASCANPFPCGGECPYRTLTDPGELYARCGDEGMCEVVQVMACAEFEAAAHGGVVNSGPCTVSEDCGIRADLNPCGCGEAITKNFPALAVQTIAEVIEINQTRCSTQCMGCEAPGDAVCGENAAGNLVCMSQ